MLPAMTFRLSVLAILTGLLLSANRASGQADSTGEKKAKPKEHYGHQLRFGLDIARPVINLLQDTRSAYEAEVDYYYKKELYFVAEGGFGNARYEYSDLSYTSKNSFFRLGIDKTLITRLGNSDWDAAFLGVRYAFAPVSRSAATYTIVDSLWGSTSGTIPEKSFTAHWAEVVGGVRVEVFKNFFAGWNVRGRFLLNGQSFKELSPAFIAGFGRGDKTTVFDFNFYLCYALRWGATPIEPAKTVDAQ
jgi:hypothetical protein